RLEDSLAAMRHAVELDPYDAEARLHLGYPLVELGRSAEAEESFRKAIDLKPDFAEAHCNLGVVLKELGRLPESETFLRNAIRFKADYAEAHWKLATNLLLQSRLRDGFELYEWRWVGTEGQKKYANAFTQPLWLGEQPLQGKTILIHAEQGLGDTVLFCRYLKLVHDLGARVVFEVQPALMPLLADLEGVDELVAKGQPLPDFDCHCPLLSLPLAFKTDLDSIPDSIPYLSAQPERVLRWASRLGGHGFKIGICWKGANAQRSVPLEHFAGLSRIPGVRLISLQKSAADEATGNVKVESTGDDFDTTGAFLDTAAVMTCCDLVITNDTSVAHVAGALGVPTWIALLFVPDWRWMMDRTDSPWYPTIRLFRQPASGDWTGAFAHMEAALRNQLPHTAQA
ncbi:MAG: tetratricopeptide repeat protein, partial [Burkholderiaceae bacterium]|nr:tetratricopeptide repeat protein [Burkholderiaceae bacterium]